VKGTRRERHRETCRETRRERRRSIDRLARSQTFLVRMEQQVRQKEEEWGGLDCFCGSSFRFCLQCFLVGRWNLRRATRLLV
jgi:hypothetical protein